MHEQAILGFLRLRSMTAYDIAGAMSKSTSFFYNVSQGSIHPALQRLLHDERVTCAQEIENGRLRKRYSITAAGLRVFEDWLESPMQVGKVKDEAVLRLFFLGVLDKAERRRVIGDYLQALQEQLGNLDELYEESLARCQDVPAELKNEAEYQLHTLRLGRDYYQFLFGRFSDLLASHSHESVD
jgi:DNA-binding PadR family transcriptional regulator